jgi:IQ domain-containing protein G
MSSSNASTARLKPIMAQRSIAVIEDCLEKLAFLGSITPDVLAHRDELSQFVGDEISRIIDEQRRLEHRYEELIAQRGILKGLSNKSKYKQNQIEIQDVSRALRESTKNLCRNLKDNPNISGNLMKIQKEREGLQDMLQRTVRELENGYTFETLVTQVDSDMREKERLDELVRREQEAKSAVRRLTTELENERRTYEIELKKRKAKISMLKEELIEIKSKTTGETSHMRKNAQAKTAATKRTYLQTERGLNVKMTTLQEKMEGEQTVHNDMVDFLSRKHVELNALSLEWEEKYANDLELKTKEFEKLTSNRERDQEILKGLQERWDQLEAEKAAKEAEERRLVELERLKREEEARRHASCIKIQRAARVYLKKKAESGGGKKKGKKGKKGKGKKGKKKKK